MLPGSAPGSQRSTPALAPQVPNYFGKGPTSVGLPTPMGMGMVPNFGGAPYGGISQPQMFGGSPQPQMGMGGYQPQQQQQRPQQPGQFGTPIQPQTQTQSPAAASTTTQQSKDPFADLAGLF